MSSGRPPAAIAVIRISGATANAAATLLAGDLPGPRSAAVRALRDPATRELLDEALVLTFAAPTSSTGEDVVELHCHGGRAVIVAVLGALGRIDGLRPAEPGEFTRRAFDHGRIDLTEAEGLADLLEAETEAQRRAALALADGALRRQIAEWQEQVLGLSAIAERAIDYADDDDAPLDLGFGRDLTALCAELDSWLLQPRIEPLKDGIRIVAAGPPNAGKSSLVNAIAGVDRAIVSAVPGTTRDYIEVPLALGGLPILLTDTAGLRESGDEVEASGVERARALIAGADIVLWLGSQADAPTHQRLILVHPKADLGVKGAAGALAVSSLTGEGVSALLDRIGASAAELLSGEDSIALNRRQAALIAEARESLATAAAGEELVIVAEGLRSARQAFDRITGRSGVEDLLDSLFARFCLGK